MGSPYQSWGLDLIKEGIFQPIGEQKSLLVCPAWCYSLMGKQEATLQNGGKEQVMSTSGVGMQNGQDPSRLQRKSGSQPRWEGFGLWWRQEDFGTPVLISRRTYCIIEGLPPGRGCKVAKDSGPRAPAGVCTLTPPKSPSSPPPAETWTSRRASLLQSFQCLLRRKVSIMLTMKERRLRESPPLSQGIYCRVNLELIN